MATTAPLSFSFPPATRFSGENNHRRQRLGSAAYLVGNPQPKLTISHSSSSPPPVVEDDPPEPSSGDTYKVPLGGCEGCGKEEKERGCNGEGRIQGGIATVPGFGWWPIKAYRPCPGFVASGGRYSRQGQSMDQVVSGRGREVRSSKKKKGSE